MPTYDYRCTACGRQVEVVHGIHATGPTSCEVCGAEMRKALSTPAIHFRGGGWAKNDAKAASATKAAGPTTSSAADTAGEPATADGAASKDSTRDGTTPTAAPDGGQRGGASKAAPKAAPAGASE